MFDRPGENCDDAIARSIAEAIKAKRSIDVAFFGPSHPIFSEAYSAFKNMADLWVIRNASSVDIIERNDNDTLGRDSVSLPALLIGFYDAVGLSPHYSLLFIGGIEKIKTLIEKLRTALAD